MNKMSRIPDGSTHLRVARLASLCRRTYANPRPVVRSVVTIGQERELVFAVRGNMTPDDFAVSLQGWPVPLSFHGGAAHRGFVRRHAEMRGVFDTGLDLFRHSIGDGIRSSRVTFAGHSSGGCIALLAAWDAVHMLPSDVRITCVTFGAPSFSDSTFASNVRATPNLDFLRVDCRDDIVPRLAAWPHLYSHVAPPSIMLYPPKNEITKEKHRDAMRRILQNHEIRTYELQCWELCCDETQNYYI